MISGVKSMILSILLYLIIIKSKGIKLFIKIKENLMLKFA